MAAVEVDRELSGALRQLVVKGDPGAPASAAADRRPREAATEGPQLRRAAGEDLLLRLADRNPDVILVENRRDRQSGVKGDRGERRRRLSR